LLEMSTVGPEAVRATRTWLPTSVEMLDAPVLGSVAEAAEGRLTVFVGATEEAFGRWAPVFEAMGTPRRLGPLGSGASMKLVVNSCLVALQATLGEALALADGLGLDLRAVLDVLVDSQIGVTARSKRSRIESGEYLPNFKLSLARKDADLVVQEARRLGIDLPVAAAAEAWMRAAAEAGLGDLDYSAVIAHIRGRPPGATE
jgi:3-hydroxyisobutyrate dehydrogenase